MALGQVSEEGRAAWGPVLNEKGQRGNSRHCTRKFASRSLDFRWIGAADIHTVKATMPADPRTGTKGPPLWDPFAGTPEKHTRYG